MTLAPPVVGLSEDLATAQAKVKALSAIVERLLKGYVITADDIHEAWAKSTITLGYQLTDPLARALAAALTDVLANREGL